MGCAGHRHARLVLRPPAGAAGRHRRVVPAVGALVVPGGVVGHARVCPRHSDRSQRHDYKRPGHCCDPAHYGLLRRPPRLVARLLLERSGCLFGELQQYDPARDHRGADQRHARAGRRGACRRAHRARPRRRARRAPAGRRRRGAARRAPPAWRPAAPPRWSCACRARRARCRTPSRSCSSSRGCSWSRSRRVDAGVDHPAGVGIRLAGREVGGGQERRDGVARRRARRCRRRRGRCSGRPRPRPARPRAARPGRGRAGCRARAGRARASRPASSTARDWSASNAPSSQKTSIQRACGAAGVEHLAADEVDVVVGAALVLGRHHVRAEERRRRR